MQVCFPNINKTKYKTFKTKFLSPLIYSHGNYLFNKSNSPAEKKYSNVIFDIILFNLFYFKCLSIIDILLK